ncbi:MAG: deoxyribodipyrimidine photo-lyase [Spirochaetes bacterium]|nr:deoxyribodipyrimidine photo-lyase [Spirochaetota bacterium]
MSLAIHWFRRDLRFEDHRALQAALAGDHPVLPLFIFDTGLLAALKNPHDARVAFIHRTLASLKETARTHGSDLLVRVGDPVEVWAALLGEFPVAAAYAAEDYEPAARRRDGAVARLLAEKGIPFNLVKDQVLFAKDEVVKGDGKPYTIYTPYSRSHLARLTESDLAEAPIGRSLRRLHKTGNKPLPFPALADLGFKDGTIAIPPIRLEGPRLAAYGERRDRMDVDGTTRLGVHLRFGTVSIRRAMRAAMPKSDVFAKELVWRDFFSQILYHFPRVEAHSFHEVGDRVAWRRDPGGFRAWCEGRTGYPLVDAGMRELAETGHMHNRVRMVAASFLTKHLLIHWKEGQAWFARHLLDFDLASNNGNWQWAAGTGCDAAPYFRIFNPAAQAKRFDPEGIYVRRWVAELGTSAYPQPIVEHEAARNRVLAAWGKARET